MEHYDIPAPERWEDFEDLCRDLWALLWEDPDTRRHGRTGQPQAGVDVYGRPRRGSEYWGVQCKLKSQVRGGKLTGKEIRDEVAKAETFKTLDRPLVGFIIATTAVSDVDVEAIVRNVNIEQVETGSFSVAVWFMSEGAARP